MLIIGTGVQSSVAVATPVPGGSVGSGHCTIASGGQAITGRTPSVTVTVKVQFADVFPHESVALHVTVVLPAGNW